MEAMHQKGASLFRLTYLLTQRRKCRKKDGREDVHPPAHPFSGESSLSLSSYVYLKDKGESKGYKLHITEQ